MDWVRKAKDFASQGLEQITGTDLEKKVKEATSNENWGTSGTLKAEIAQATKDYQGFREVMGIVWKRIGEKASNWRIVFKTLDLLNFLIQNGAERVADEARDHQSAIRALENFHHFDTDTGIDRGKGIRELAKKVLDLLNDFKRLQKLRKESAKTRSRFDHIGSTGFGSNTGGRGGGGGGYNSQWAGSSYKSRSSEDQWGSSRSYEDRYKSDDRSEESGRKKKKKKGKKKKKHHHSDEDEDEEDPWEDRTPKKKKKKKKKRSHHDTSEDESEEEESESEDSEEERRRRKKKKKKKAAKAKAKSKTKKTPVSGMKLDGPPGSGGGSAQASAILSAPTGGAAGGDIFGDFASSDPFGGDDFAATAFPDAQPAAPAKGGFDDFDTAFQQPAAVVAAPVQAAPAQAAAAADDWGTGFGDFSGGGAAVAPKDDFFGQPAPAAAQPAVQPAAAKSSPMDFFGSTPAAAQPVAAASQPAPDFMGFGAMPTPAQPQPVVPVAAPVQEPVVPEPATKPAEPAKEKKKDLFSMAGGLVDLDNFADNQQKYAAFDPDQAKEKKSSGLMPSLSSYGGIRPNLTGMAPTMQMGGMRGMGMGQVQMGMQGMSMNARPQMGMAQMGMGQMGMGMQPQMGAGMGQMGMAQMGMGQMGMGRPMGGGMGQMGAGGGMGQMGMGMGMGGGFPQQQQRQQGGGGFF